jgi:preprotein translocase SecE subunit
MDSRKTIVGSYLGVSALVWFLLRSFVQWLNFTFYQVRKLPGIDVIRESLPVVGGLVTFLILLKHPKVNEVMDDVVAELKKVTWPSTSDVKKSTIVVMFCILIASGILAFFDLFFGKVVGALMKLS